MKPTHAPKLTELLMSAFRGEDGDPPKTTISQIVLRLEHQALAALILIFAVPNILPTPPGTSAVTGLPLVFLTLQMIFATPPWLPKFIAKREVPRAPMVAAIEKAQAWLHRIERAIYPRLAILVSAGAERIVGVIALLLSLVIMLPIPLGNTLPSLSLGMIALGFLGRDGVWVLAGLITAVGAVTLLATVWWAALRAVMAGFGL